MSTTIDKSRVSVEPAAVRAWSQQRTIYVELHDGRIVGFSADRFRILAAASEAQLAKVVGSRLRRWQQLLTASRDGLSVEAQCGLWGELHMLGADLLPALRGAASGTALQDF